jgi:8-oxo-dGTP diphosphatase
LSLSTGFKIRVGVVVLDADKRILLARQNKRLFWVLPGGTLEQGESVGECAVREIKEEANLDITLGPLLYVGDFFTPDGRQVLDMVFFGHLQGGVLQRETSENLDEIGFYSKTEAIGKILKPEKVFEAIFASWENITAQSGLYLGKYG